MLHVSERGPVIANPPGLLSLSLRRENRAVLRKVSQGGASTPKSRGYFSPNLTATLCYRQVHCGIYFEAVCRPSFKDSFEDCSFQLHAQWLKAWTATFFCKGRTGESVSLSRPHSICRRYWPWPYTAVAATDRLRSERPGHVPTGPLNSWTRNLESCVIFIHCEILL